MALLFENSPAQSYQSYTPADVDLAVPFRGVFVGGAGTLVLTGLDGVVATFTVLAGQSLNVCGKRIAAASTATGIVILR